MHSQQVNLSGGNIAIRGTYFTSEELTEDYKRTFGTAEAVVFKPQVNNFSSRGPWDYRLSRFTHSIILLRKKDCGTHELLNTTSTTSEIFQEETPLILWFVFRTQASQA